jgi:predicted DsbA family dithiol-disulfide isomerase
MKVDIWSDVRCPYCYIGKRKFEYALAQFEHKEEVEIEWHSFELDPTAETLPDENVYDYLAKKYGKSREWALSTHQQVAEVAAAVGLKFNFDISVVANSFDAHRLIQLAKTKGLGDEAEERLFKAYFTEGKNISDHQTLMEIGSEIRLDLKEVELMLEKGDFADDVRYDQQMANNIGVKGVPFFVFNQKLAVSGAQSPDTFLGAMNQAWSK